MKNRQEIVIGKQAITIRCRSGAIWELHIITGDDHDGGEIRRGATLITVHVVHEGKHGRRE